MKLNVFIKAIDVFSRIVLVVYLVLAIVFKVRLPQELRWAMLLTWLILFSVARFYYYRIKHNRHD